MCLTGVLGTGIVSIQQQYRSAGRCFIIPETAVVAARIDPELKHNAKEVFRKLSLTATQAITPFCKQVELERGLCHAVRVPNDITMEALEKARARQELDDFNTLDDLFEDLGI